MWMHLPQNIALSQAILCVWGGGGCTTYQTPPLVLLCGSDSKYDNLETYVKKFECDSEKCGDN